MASTSTTPASTLPVTSSINGGALLVAVALGIVLLMAGGALTFGLQHRARHRA